MWILWWFFFFSLFPGLNGMPSANCILFLKDVKYWSNKKTLSLGGWPENKSQLKKAFNV